MTNDKINRAAFPSCASVDDEFCKEWVKINAAQPAADTAPQAPSAGSVPVGVVHISADESWELSWNAPPYVSFGIGDHALYAAPAEAVDSMVIARLKESLRAKSRTALTVTCWRADLIALLAASMGGEKS